MKVRIVNLVIGALVTLPAAGGFVHAEPFSRQQVLAGESAGDQFGFAAAALGDIDGDGRGELAIGANVNDALAPSGGRAYVFRGGPGWPAAPLFSVAGDLERGYAGGALAGGADTDGDGYADWIVGAPGPGPDGLSPGYALVFRGAAAPDAVPDLTLTGQAPGGQFGGAVCLVPDFNGDGYADLAVGSPRAGNGRVALYLGGPGGLGATPAVIIHARAQDARFGAALAALPDRDGDGRDELLVGVPHNSAAATWAGAVLVYDGSAGLDTIPDLVLSGTAAGDEFGAAIDTGGDADADGAPDVLVGAPFANANLLVDAGRAYLFRGGAALDAVADLVLAGGSAGEHFGYAVALGFDWDGDGAGDLAVGAPERSLGGAYAGGMDIWFGGGALDAARDVTVAGDAPDLHLGTTVTGSGDLLGNGDRGLCVGGFGGAGAGEAWLYGRAGATAVPPDATVRALLGAPWPNPANPRVQVELDLVVAGPWRVTVTDLAGRRLATLHDGPLPPGITTFAWDGRDEAGRPAASGVYLAGAASPGTVQTRPFTLVR